MFRVLSNSAIYVHGDIRHLENIGFDSTILSLVHGDIRHLEISCMS